MPSNDHSLSIIPQNFILFFSLVPHPATHTKLLGTLLRVQTAIP